jgi:hypothetical protein
MATDTAAAAAQVTTAWLTSPELDAGLPFSNTPIHLVGPNNNQKVSELSPLATLWEQQHQILAIGCPLAEALNLTQLTSFHITKLESNTTDTSISTLLQHKWPTQAQDVFMTNLPIFPLAGGNVP